MPCAFHFSQDVGSPVNQFSRLNLKALANEGRNKQRQNLSYSTLSLNEAILTTAENEMVKITTAF